MAGHRFLVGAGDDTWRLANHMSGAMDGELPALAPAEGGGIGYVDGYFVSTMYQLVPLATGESVIYKCLAPLSVLNDNTRS